MTDAYQKLLKLETTPEALEATVCYLSAQIKPFLQTLEPVLICYPDAGPASLGGLFKEAVLRCDAKPILWGPDYRWRELLRIAFDTHANTVVGHPQVVLGLMKLARATSTPLNIYNVIVCGDPFSHWMVNDLKNGLDCKVWGCYAVKSGPVIAGFSCVQEAGIHIREDVFLPVVPNQSEDAPFVSGRGKICFRSAKNPEIIFDPMEESLIHYQPCSCGCDAPRLAELTHYSDEITINHLEERLLSWSSVLDYRVEHTESGINLELVVFPGEKLPKLPTCAKLTVRSWNPQEDIPFFIQDTYLKIPENTVETIDFSD